MSRKGEWILWGAAALLLLAVCAAAVQGAGFRARDRDLFRSFRAACIPVLSRPACSRAVGRGDFLPKYRGIVFGQYAGAA